MSDTVNIIATVEGVGVSTDDPSVSVSATIETISVVSTSVSTIVSSDTVEVVGVASVQASVVNAATVELITAAVQGPPGVSTPSTSTFATTNKDVTTLAQGTACATHATGVGVVKASAANGSKQCVGLVTTTTSPTDACTVQTAGPFEMSDWTSITGSQLLSASAIYYLDTTSGKLTTVSPSSNPAVSQKVGKAVSPTILNIERGYPVQL
jgi:hypothetical protein